MQVVKFILGLSVFVFALLPAAGVCADGEVKDPLHEFSEEHRKKLLKGEAIYESVFEKDEDKGEKAHGRAVALINATAEEAYKIFCDFSKEYLYFPRMTKSDVLSTEGNVSRVYKELSSAIGSIIYTHFMTRHDDEFRVDFEMDPAGKNSVKESAGYFQFVKVDNESCLFIYGLTKGELEFSVPAPIKKFATSRDLPKIVLAVKKRVESGGTWEKDD